MKRDETDIVSDLRDWAAITDDTQGKAALVMLSGRVFSDAAAEIERLRAEIIAVRAERDSAQTQADHLAQRLVQEARRG